MSMMPWLALILASGSIMVANAAQLAPPDTIAERVKPCLTCHAAEGRLAKNEYYPRLAGKPQGYLFSQMVSFRDGRRHNRAMALLMQNLSDAYLAEIAGYFAAQPPQYSVATNQTRYDPAPALVTTGDPSRKIPACVACHGNGLMGVTPAIPGLLGLPRDFVSALMGAWRVGSRRAVAPDCMGEIAKQLSDVEVTAISTWLAAQPFVASARPAPALTEALPVKCGNVSAVTATSTAP